MKPYTLFIITAMLLACNICQSQPKLKTAYAKETIQQIGDKSYQGLKPGDIAPDAVQIDADGFSKIINGAVIVTKGNKYGLVDLAGNFLVPYGRYEFLRVNEHSEPATALIPVQDPVTRKEGYINAKGEVVIPLEYRNLSDFDYNRIAHADIGIGMKPVRFDTQGRPIAPNNFKTVNPYDFHERDTSFQDNLKPIPFQTSLGKFGYADRYGSMKFSYVFDDAMPFTDGMAAVKKIDEFGVGKWGFIDLTGRLVIPYTFQIQPGNFHNGRALVRPLKVDGFDYAYIDKTGAVKRMLGDGKKFPYMPVGASARYASNASYDRKREFETVGYFFHGFSLWKNEAEGVQLMDMDGNFMGLEFLCQVPEIAHSKKGLGFVKTDDLGIYFTGTANLYWGNNTGLMDFNGNVLFPPIFDELYPDYYSHYAFVRIRPNSSKDVAKAGIVNQQGVFVLITKPKSVF